MAHNTRIRPNIGAWSPNSAVLQTDYEALDAAQFAAINGDAGGIWSPSAGKIIIGGTQGLDMVAPMRVLGASDFSASMQAQNWPERPSVAGSGLALNGDVPICWDNSGNTGGLIGTNRYVAVGNDQKSYTAEDGSAWTQRSLTGGVQVSAVAAGIISGAAGILAVDGGVNGTYTSANGISWLGGGAVGGPFGAALYVAALGLWIVAGTGAISTSANGTSWTARTVPGGWAGKFGKRIAWNGSVLVVATNTSYDSVITSPDGVTWTLRTVGSIDTRTGLAWGAYDGVFLLTGATTVYKSADGATWTSCAPTGIHALNDLAVQQSLWVGPVTGGTNGGLSWSVDQGATWRSAHVGNHLTMLGYPRIIAADNRFVMARSSSTALDFALSMRSS